MQTAFRSEDQFTHAEFARWLQDRPSSDINRYELLGGRIVMTPPARHPHGTLEGEVCGALRQYVRANDLGIVNGSSTGYELPSGEVVAPDVSFVSNATIAAGPVAEPGSFLRIVPDLVVEILSKTTAARDRSEKKRIYGRAGVAEYWVVEPERRRVTVFYRDGAAFSAANVLDSGVIASRQLPNLGLTVEEIFALV
ncbi:MAG TPA: Uma2 family endonuclease [Candidatus Binatia bacterium]|nr:Uma2 family endonuclease [Candidatus Binatia bacterium]